MDYATSFVQLGLDYCESMFDGDLLPAVNALRVPNFSILESL